nr:YceI family protein [Bacteriovorax sp. HI3]
MKRMIALCSGVLMMGSVMAHEVTVKVALSPAGSFEAKSAKVKGDVKKDGNKFTAENLWVKVEELKTGISLRDEHFHKHLNFEKSPKITFSQVSAADGKGTGTLTVNDVKKPVDFTYKQVNPNKIEATFKVKPSELKLKPAEYMGIGVTDEVEVVAVIDV